MLIDLSGCRRRWLEALFDLIGIAVLGLRRLVLVAFRASKLLVPVLLSRLTRRCLVRLLLGRGRGLG